MLITSILSSFLIGLMINSQPVSIEKSTIRTYVVGLIFSIICIFGILAALFPKQCSRTFHGNKDKNFKPSQHTKYAENHFEKKSSIFNIMIVHGHHTLCKEFSHHEFQMLGKTFCIGCYGLLSGAILSLSVMILYLFRFWTIKEYTFNIMVLFGIIGVNLGLIKPLLAKLKRKILRYLIEVFFVFGIFALLVTVDIALKNLMADLYIILLSLYWLWTKITVTRFVHDKTCSICVPKC